MIALAGCRRNPGWEAHGKPRLAIEASGVAGKRLTNGHGSPLQAYPLSKKQSIRARARRGAGCWRGPPIAGQKRPDTGGMGEGKYSRSKLDLPSNSRTAA